ncbi:MAG TPA: PilZ domain-containing protein [Leptospiraceae bacterium]|nr:PilZ domain-containing protein [Leptospiraceae bacterium]HMW06805.1 PilZ domain-containing protein [Leptospiraceae bacterium]HMX32179.1 PilZ domain-containing protein [Leptospiraceae bacterium]HMY32249.1 PilZ domain-containing protein [Leptospiraceae bacterium]HMZ63938.1 PilZ domain-containing protein [Leptospiraceae bacterium]
MIRLLDTLKLKYTKRLFLSSGAISVRLPLSLNIAGKIYHLETNMISREYIFIKIYEEDFEFLPSVYSHIILFMNLDLFNIGKYELEGKLVSIDKIAGSRCGLWIEYKTETESDRKTISQFVQNHYTPRYSVRFSVEIKTDHKTLRGEAINLSEKGIFIEAELGHLEENKMYSLILYLESDIIHVNAQVSWINKGKMYDKPNGYGLKFLPDKNAEKKITQYLNTLKKRSAILR